MVVLSQAGGGDPEVGRTPQLFMSAGRTSFADGFETLVFGGAAFFGFRTSLLPLRWLFATSFSPLVSAI
jgi:hypothetical protein